MEPLTPPSPARTQPRPLPLWPCLLIIALATIASGLHTTVVTLLFQRLASQHIAFLALPHSPPDATVPPPPPATPPVLPGSGTDRDDTPAQALAAHWGTALWVSVACINTVSITFYTLKGSVWGRKALVLLGLASSMLFELVYFVVARDSVLRADGGSGQDSQLHSHLGSSRRSILGFSPHFLVLFITEILAAALGSYQVVTTASLLTLFDLSTSKTRARNINYFMAAFLLGGTLGPLIVGEVLGRLADALGEESGWDTLQLAFLSSIAVAASALLCAIFFLTETLQKAEAEAPSHRADGETSSSMEPKESYFSPSYWLTHLTSTWHRFSEILCYHPPSLGSKHRYPLVKLLLALNLVAQAFSAYSYVQLLIDWKFHWGAKENGLFFSVLWGSKFLALVFLVPWALAATRRVLARKREARDKSRSGEEEPLLNASRARPGLGRSGGPRDSTISIATKNDPAKSILPWENPSPWVGLVSFLIDFMGWGMMALGIGLSKPTLVLLGTATNSLAVGAVPSVHNYAVEILSHEEDEAENEGESESDGEGDGSTEVRESQATPRTPSLATQRRLDGWVAVTSLSEGAVGVLAPLLLGTIYTSSLETAPWAICAWTASQFFLCAVLIATL
ncbi:hypothetical protein BCV69DRAFT_275447 [Microstroma glucosiphilum]|uniref:MFS general substrate transporter n=1 Tax=Pseudomicrostroma glucosiphilum TaxID=1684307 RepID=A0A316UFS6_9BASI|nr:hypothetical protein BCV69DRAFT_275447 [Pseudomicrostroma glucosiphilum]PWN24112.1 hypothetical protein BCV69DRAFT_275447 [Pseudomicrostroma glucosiphilum]